MTVTVGIILASLRGRPRFFFGDASNVGFGGLETSLPLLVILICFFGVVFIGSLAAESFELAVMSRSATGSVLGSTAWSG